MSLILSKRAGSKEIYMNFSTAFGSRYYKVTSVGVDEETGFGSLPTTAGFLSLPLFERASESARYGDFKRYSYTVLSTAAAQMPSGDDWTVVECKEETPEDTYCTLGEYSYSAGASIEFRKCGTTTSYRCRGFGSEYTAGASCGSGGGASISVPDMSEKTETGQVADPDLGIIYYEVEETVCGLPGDWTEVATT